MQHAEMFCKMRANFWARGAQRDDEDSPEDSRYVTHVNILVPCPHRLSPASGIGTPTGVKGTPPTADYFFA